MLKNLLQFGSKHPIFSLGALYALIGCLVYIGIFSAEFVLWDDPLLITQSEDIRGLTVDNIRSVFSRYDPELYIPLTFLSFQIDYVINGLNPLSFHIQNLLWHILNALLVCWLCTLLSKNKLVGIITGLLFLVHPLHTEAVAWASGRKDVLSTFFFLGSIITYIKATQSKDDNYQLQTTTYSLSLILFLSGLLAKVSIVTLPIILLLLDWIRYRKLSFKLFLEKIPFFLLSIIFGIIAILGKTSILDNASTSEKIIMAGKSTFFYLQKMFVPTGLSVLHPYSDPIALTSPNFFIPWIVVIAIPLIITFWLSGYYRKLAFFCLSFYLITLAPTFTNFAKNENIYVASERYAYIPSIGIFFLVVSLFIHWIHMHGNDDPRHTHITPLSTLPPLKLIIESVLGGFAILLICSLLTFHQVSTWQSTEALFTNVLRHYPQNYLSYDYLGITLTNQRRFDDARIAYERALEFNPPDPERIHGNLGALYGEMGELDKEIEQYELSLAVDPDSLPVRYNLARSLTDAGKISEAKKQFELILDVDPDFHDARELVENL